MREQEQKEEELDAMEAEIPEKYLEEMKEESQKRGREQYLSSSIQGSVNLVLNKWQDANRSFSSPDENTDPSGHS